MAMLSYLAVLVLITAVMGQPPVTVPVVTREIGSPQCLVDFNSNNMTMTFVSKLNDDDITAVIGCAWNATSQSYYAVECDFNAFTVNGDRYIQIDSTVSLEDPNWDAAINPCGVQPVEITPGNYHYRFRLGFRRVAGYILYGDQDYQFACYKDNAFYSYLSTNIDIQFDNLVTPVDVRNPRVALRVLDTNYNEIDTCEQNDLIRLELLMQNTVPYQDYLSPYGLYGFDTWVGGSLSDLEVHQLIGLDGCATNNPYQHTGDGFVLDESRSDLTMDMHYFTSTFRCKRFKNTDLLFFVTYINTCSGLSTSLQNSDDKCYNYCQYTTTLNGRRRRQASNGTDPLNVYTMIRITDAKEEEGAMSKTVLIAIGVAVSVLVVALIAIFGCALCFLGRLKKRERERKSPSGSYQVSSRASSTQQLPVKF